MPRKPTGRPSGRPKTKEYVKFSLRMDIVLDAKMRLYATRHHLTCAEVIRRGLIRLVDDPPHED